MSEGFPGSSVVKNLLASAGEAGVIPAPNFASPLLLQDLFFITLLVP